MFSKRVLAWSSKQYLVVGSKAFKQRPHLLYVNVRRWASHRLQKTTRINYKRWECYQHLKTYKIVTVSAPFGLAPVTFPYSYNNIKIAIQESLHYSVSVVWSRFVTNRVLQFPAVIYNWVQYNRNNFMFPSIPYKGSY